MTPARIAIPANPAGASQCGRPVAVSDFQCQAEPNDIRKTQHRCQPRQRLRGVAGTGRALDVDALALAQRVHFEIGPLVAQEPDRRNQKTEVNDRDKALPRHRKLIGPFAMAQVLQVGISSWVVRELVVPHVEQAIEMDRRHQGKHAKQVGNQVVERAVFHERIMRRFMTQTR